MYQNITASLDLLYILMASIRIYYKNLHKMPVPSPYSKFFASSLTH